jgi:MFS family permease
MDKWGTRKVLGIVTPIYILVLLLMRFVTNVVPELVILISFLRLLGPECLILISRSTLNRWFVEQRGKASAMMSVPTGLVFMTQSILVSFLIEKFGWRNSYTITAMILTPCLVTGVVLLRDSPESVGLKPDITWSSKKDDEKKKGKYITVSSTDVELTTTGATTTKSKLEEEEEEKVNFSLVEMGIETTASSELEESKTTTTTTITQDDTTTTTTTTRTASLEGMTLSQTVRTAMFWAIAIQPASIFWSGKLFFFFFF